MTRERAHEPRIAITWMHPLPPSRPPLFHLRQNSMIAWMLNESTRFRIWVVKVLKFSHPQCENPRLRDCDNAAAHQHVQTGLVMGRKLFFILDLAHSNLEVVIKHDHRYAPVGYTVTACPTLRSASRNGNLRTWTSCNSIPTIQTFIADYVFVIHDSLKLETRNHITVEFKHLFWTIGSFSVFTHTTPPTQGLTLYFQQVRKL